MKLELRKYLENSTIHGLSYISNRNVFVEKIFWIFSLIISVICTSVLIVQLVIKINNVPILVYLSDQSVPVSKINFPSVTVCPEFKTNLLHYKIKKDPKRLKLTEVYAYYEKHTLRRITYENEEYLNDTQDERRFGNIFYEQFLDRIENFSIKPEELGSKLLKRLQVVDLIKNLGTFQKINYSIPTDDFLDVINEFSKEFDDFLSIVFYWIGTYQNRMSEIITPWGLCFTHNIAFSHDLLNHNTTSSDFYYENTLRLIQKTNPNQPIEDLPKRISTANAGLWVGFYKLNQAVDLRVDGYTSLFHDPFELPSKRSKVIETNLKVQTKILIEPQMNSIDESLIGYEPAERNCYLENEKILKFFKVYTKNNCENECLTDFMLSRCGCVEFFMIRNPSTRICSASEKDCYKKAEKDYKEQKSACECYDPCDYVKYNYEYHEHGPVHTKSFKTIETSGFWFQYKKDVFIRLVRKKQFNELDFMSFVGGILGLFAGFSALSFIELVYWFTIRVIVMNWKTTNSKVHPLNNFQGYNSRIKQIKEFVKTYFNESSIHGLNFIVGVSRVGNIIWTITVLSAMTLCFHLITDVQDKVPDSLVVAYDDDFKSIQNIPFPAITIVPAYSIPSQMISGEFYLKVIKPRFGQEDLRNETTREAFKRNLTQYHFCYNTYDLYGSGYNFSLVPYLIRVLKENSKRDWFREQFSSLNGKYQPEFAEIRTSRGMGFTFNMIDADEMFDFDRISSEFNYTRNITTKPMNLIKIQPATPIPLTFNRNDKVLTTIKLSKPQELSWECNKPAILVHYSEYLSTFSTEKHFFTYNHGANIEIVVIPEITQTDEELKKLKPENRKCYFKNEHSLKFFKKYSQKNCEVECFANITMERCGCVDITQPFTNSNDICLKISSKGIDDCYAKLLQDLYEVEDFSFIRNCSCLPLCNSISYNTKYYTKHESGGNETTINVRMNMDDIVLFRRYQQFTFSDVVSYVGGLLGLFAGISMLSIVEFFYFFTIRLAVNLWRILRDS